MAGHQPGAPASYTMETIPRYDGTGEQPIGVPFMDIRFNIVVLICPRCGEEMTAISLRPLDTWRAQHAHCRATNRMAS